MSSDINVVATTQHIMVDPASKSVAVISMGPQGPQGPTGDVSQAQFDAAIAAVQADADAKVAKTGDTMTGRLTIQRDGEYVHLQITNASGGEAVAQLHGTAGGRITLDLADTAGIIFNESEGALYIIRDNAMMRFRADGIVEMMSGFHLHVNAPTDSADATTKLYVDNADATLTSAANAAQTDATQALADAATAQTTADAKVAKTGDTMTGALLVSNTGPNIDLIKSNATLNTGRWRIAVLNAGSDGGLYIGLRDDAGNTLGWPIVIQANGTIKLQTAGASLGTPIVEVPAITGVNQAARVTAYDATTGRLAIGNCEVGDTGWRNITSLLVNGWTATAVLCRRTGAQVWVSLDNLNGSAATSNQVLVLPTGFGSTKLLYNVGAGTAAGALDKPMWVSAASALASSTRLNSILGMFQFPTDVAWPTSLPGTSG